MNIFARLSSLIDDVGHPLYAVTLSAVPRPDTPLLLVLHWHGFAAGRSVTLPGVAPPIRSVPGSALQLNDRWQTLEAVEAAIFDAAWQLGAWDVERLQRRGCNDIAAWSREALDCRQAFGELVAAPEHDIGIDDDAAPDRTDLLMLAARRGYVRWLFRPVRGGLNGAGSDDASLKGDGTREPPCPVRPTVPFGGAVRGRPEGTRQRFRLGRGAGLIAP